jgi:hypothetical protein
MLTFPVVRIHAHSLVDQPPAVALRRSDGSSAGGTTQEGITGTNFDVRLAILELWLLGAPLVTISGVDSHEALCIGVDRDESVDALTEVLRAIVIVDDAFTAGLDIVTAFALEI